MRKCVFKFGKVKERKGLRWKKQQRRAWAEVRRRAEIQGVGRL